MIRMRKMTDYGIVILAHFARHDAAHMHSARSVAEETRLAPPTVSKLLKHLTTAGLLTSSRGASGGYQLSVLPESINLAEIVEALEGPIGITECSEPGGNQCEETGHCKLSMHWPHINLAVRAALAAITLSDISRPLPLPLPLSNLAAGASPSSSIPRD
jgi:FeS assembly SUF system regulator